MTTETATVYDHPDMTCAAPVRPVGPEPSNLLDQLAVMTFGSDLEQSRDLRYYLMMTRLEGRLLRCCGHGRVAVRGCCRGVP